MFLVTGANGFIGSAIVSELNRKKNEEIIITDEWSPNSQQRPLNQKRYQYKTFYSASDLLLKKHSEIQWNKFKGVFHMGACSSTTETNKEYLWRTNTEYTKKLWTLCAQQRIPFIYASSAAIYGDGQNGFDDLTSSQNFKALNLYGESKREFDVWAENQRETPPVWYGLRFFNVYGPNEYHKESMRSLVCKAYEEIQKTGKLKLFKSHRPDYRNGEQLRDFVYIKDVTRWILELFEHKERIPSGLYNMGYGKARTWLDLASQIFKSMEKSIAIEWIDIPENIRDQYQYYTEAPMKKWISNGLSNPQWDLETGVDDYIVHYLEKKNLYLNEVQV